MPLCDVLRVLNEGRTLRGSIELDDSLLGWSVRFVPPRSFLIEMDELPLDEPALDELIDHRETSPLDDGLLE